MVLSNTTTSGLLLSMLRSVIMGLSEYGLYLEFSGTDCGSYLQYSTDGPFDSPHLSANPWLTRWLLLSLCVSVLPWVALVYLCWLCNWHFVLFSISVITQLRTERNWITDNHTYIYHCKLSNKSSEQSKIRSKDYLLYMLSILTERHTVFCCWLVRNNTHSKAWRPETMCHM
jgi:hypothetical protein